MSTFSTATNFPVATSPNSLVVGDFNKDGQPDIATSNESSNNLSILLGTGEGFDTATNFNIGFPPGSLELGDFNSDGNLDIASTGTGGVAILLGNGTGSFGSPTSFDTGENISAGSSVGDFNGDSKPDLVTVNSQSNNVSILLGTGTGSFGVPTKFNAGTGPQSVVVGDFNVDGKLDLATANSLSNNISILLGTGSGSFGVPANFNAGIKPRSIVTGDFNADGKLDLATANQESNNISILLGTGTGSFGVPTNFNAGTSPYSVAVGDFNNDNKSDLAVANNGANNVSILLGNGTGSFAAASNFGAGTNPYAVAVGDFNDDDKTDLATANYQSNNVSVLLNNTPVVNFGDAINTDRNTVINIPVTISSSPVKDLIVPIAINPSSTATIDLDYTLSPTTLTFRADTNTLTQNVAVTVIDDNIAENTEIAVFNLGAITDGIAGKANETKLTIAVNDPITYAVAAGTASIAEGNSGSTTPVTFTVTRSGGINAVGSVNYAIGGTATNSSDYNNIGGTSGANAATGTINFAAGETSKTITLNVLGDADIEPDETITVTLSNQVAPGPIPTITTATATTTIDNDDSPAVTVIPTTPPAPTPILPSPGIIINPTSGFVTTEAGGTDKFTIKLNSQPTADVRIYLSSNNVAEGIISTPSITFNSTNWNQAQTVTVTGVDDSVYDGNKSYTIVTKPAVSNDSNYFGLNAADVTVTNNDNDTSTSSNSTFVVDPVTGQEYKSGELLVKLKSDATGVTIQSDLFTANGAVEVEDLVPPTPSSNAINSTSQGIAFFSENSAIALETAAPSDRQSNSPQPQLPQWRMVKIAANKDLQQVKENLARDPRVEAVELNYQVSIQQTPSDPEFNELWSLNNTGQTDGTLDADIDAPEAWDVQKGSKNVVVAVIDSGVDYKHQDLAANIWSNTRETAGDGIDNDSNGYKDDVRGYDFINNDNDPMDDNSHGSHVAGIIGAVGNNNIGVVGVSQNVSMMPLKVIGANGRGSTNAIAKAINYASQNGAKVINASFGGNASSKVMKDAIADANKKGVLFVAAAGNEGKNNDNNQNYPANYDLPNIIAVAATNDRDQLARFSNYGKTSVDLGAPGVDILSTIPGNQYGFQSGTSMASPQVAGAAALLLAENPNLSVTQLKDSLMKTTDPLTSLNGKTVSGGRLNIGKALNQNGNPPNQNGNAPNQNGNAPNQNGNPPNQPPVLNYGETTTPWHFDNSPVNKSSTFEYTFPENTFTDPDPGDKLTYTATLMDGSPLPNWLTLNSDTRTLSGKSPKPQEFKIKLTATDKAGASVSDDTGPEKGMLLKFSSTGVVIDGYISGATFFLDANKNGIKDSNEPSTTTDSNGEFNLNIPFETFDINQNGEIDPSEGHLVATGGTDTATGLPLETPVTAPSDSTVVTLLTSLVADLIDRGISSETAQSLVKTSLSLPAEVDLTSLDPIEATNNNEPGGVQVLAEMVKVQNSITQTAALIDGASSAANTDIVKAVVSSITNQIQSGTVLNLSNAADLEPIIQQAAAKIQQIDSSFDSQKVTPIISQAATVMATANQRVDSAVSSTATSIPEAVARVQKVALGQTTQDFKAVGAGNKPISQVVSDNSGTALDTKIQAVTLPAGIGTPIVAGDADLGSNSPNQVLGTNGDDILISNSANDVLMGMRGNDSLDSRLGNDSLFGGKGSDNLLGGSGDDALFGGRGADILNGGDGDDILLGGNGDDFLNGGLGNDILTGGNGSDRFLLNPDRGSDTILDFEVGIDKFALGNGLTFQQLEISQTAGGTLLIFASTGKVLATVTGLNSSITASDFIVL
jgi:subtilisin family serine protease/Ca2+-binding RTX toxin-like protein